MSRHASQPSRAAAPGATKGAEAATAISKMGMVFLATGETGAPSSTRPLFDSARGHRLPKEILCRKSSNCEDQLTGLASV